MGLRKSRMRQDRFGRSSHPSPQEIAALEGHLLSPRRERRLRRHLQECPDCRRHLDEVRAIRSLLRNAPSPPPPRELTLSPRRVRPGRPVLWYPVFRAATAVVAVLVLFLFLADPLGLSPRPALATPRPIAVKPSPSASPSPRPAAVEPAITRRQPPTGLAGTSGLLSTPAVFPSEAAYPGPQPTPWIRATVSRTQTVVAPPTGGGGDALLWPLRAGGLLLLGLVLGLTWWTYRRERLFL